MEIGLFITLSAGAGSVQKVAIGKMRFIESNALLHQLWLPRSRQRPLRRPCVAGNQDQTFFKLYQPVALDNRACRAVARADTLSDQQRGSGIVLFAAGAIGLISSSSL